MYICKKFPSPINKILIQRAHDVYTTTPERRYDVEATLFKRHVPAGTLPVTTMVNASPVIPWFSTGDTTPFFLQSQLDGTNFTSSSVTELTAWAVPLLYSSGRAWIS